MPWTCGRCGARGEVGGERHRCGPRMEIEFEIEKLGWDFDQYDGEIGRELKVICDFLEDSGDKRMAVRMNNALNDIKRWVEKLEKVVLKNELPDLEDGEEP